MQSEKIGTLIEKMRVEKNYRQKDISRGICSEQMLSKIESGERIPDKMLLEYILQRLNCSVEYMEMIISVEEYKEIEQHDRILELIFNENKKEAKIELYDYQGKYETTRIRAQFTKMCEAYISILDNCKVEDTLKLFIESISITFPDWNNGIEAYLLSTLEVEILINIGDLYIRCGEQGIGEEILISICKYIRENITNETERAKLYPKCICLLTRYQKTKMNPIYLLAGLEEGYELLRKQGVLYCIGSLLGELYEVYDYLHLDDNAQKILHQWEAIREVTSCVNMEKSMELLPLYIWPSPMYYIDCEMIREERIIKKMTQENLAEGIYENPASLSRIENGRFPPKKTKFYQLMSKTEINKVRYNTLIATDDHKILDSDVKFTKAMSRRFYKEIDDQLEWSKIIEDTQIAANKQRILLHKLSIKLLKNEISIEEGLSEATEILEKTYSYDINNFRIPMDTEMLAINKIAICHKRLNEYDKAIEIYCHLKKSFEKSRVSEKYHTKGIQMIMHNLSDCYEKKTEYEKSRRIMKECIIHEIEIGRGHLLGDFYSTYIHLNNMCIGITDSVEEFQSSLHVFELYYKEKEKEILENICKKLEVKE